MNPDVFERLASSRKVKRLMAQMSELTGLTLTLVPASSCNGHILPSYHPRSNFCRIACTTETGQLSRDKLVSDLQSAVSSRNCPCERECFAGMTHVAFPIRIRGRHVATILGGEVFRKKPSRRKFNAVVGQLRAWSVKTDGSELERAYFCTSILSTQKYRAVIQWLQQLADEIARNGCGNGKGKKTSSGKLVSRVKRYIHGHFAEDITAACIACHFGLTESHLCRMVKRETGATLGQYLTSARIERAKAMLADMERQIKAISRDCGFPTVSHFNRVFKSHTGVTPSEHRRYLIDQ